MELLLRLAGVISSTSVSLLLSNLRLATSLAEGLLFPLGIITTETTERIETTKTIKPTKTTDTQTIRRRKRDDIQYIMTKYNDDAYRQGRDRWMKEEDGEKMG